MAQAFSLILDQLLLLKLQKRVWIHIQILFPGFCLCHHSREACFHEKQEGLEGGGSDPNPALSSQSTVRMDTHTLTWKQMWADPTQRARDYTQTEPDMMTLQRTKRLGIVHFCRFIRLVHSQNVSSKYSRLSLRLMQIPKLYLFNFQLCIALPHATFHSFLPWIFHTKKICFSKNIFSGGGCSIPKLLVYISRINNNRCVRQEAVRAERSIVSMLGGLPSG